jgi:hypothetical protein
MPGGALGDELNARPAACKAAARPAERRGFAWIHFGCARARASRRTWCLAARDLASGRAHPGPPTPCRVATECKDTPEVERMTGLEPMSWPWRGLALPAELHPQRCKTDRRPVPRLSRGNLLKSVRRKRRCDPLIAGLRRCASRGKQGKTKRPGSFRSPGLCVQRFEGAQLRASLSRMHSALAPIKLLQGKWLHRRIGRMQGRTTRTQRLHRRSTGERDQTLHGSAGSDGVAGFHDGVLGTLALTGAGWDATGRTVNSLYAEVNPL